MQGNKTRGICAPAAVKSKKNLKKIEMLQKQLNNRVLPSKIRIALERRRFLVVEKVYKMTRDGKTAIEKIILDENLQYFHMTFQKDEGLPVHHANSNVYMSVLGGTLSIGLDDGQVREYEDGTILNIPVNTKMNVKNLHEATLELIVIKVPPPA